MSKQLSLGEGFEKYAKTTRREHFLREMERVVPWDKVCALVEPVYPVAGNGRPPRALAMMVRVYFLQQWFNLSDPATEDALYDSVSMRRFAGLDYSEAPAPDETTLCKFRHLLERHGLGEAMFTCVREHLEGLGLKIGVGTIPISWFAVFRRPIKYLFFVAEQTFFLFLSRKPLRLSPITLILKF